MSPGDRKQEKQTYCEYCHTDRDGYVAPLEKNCHAFVRCSPIHGWVLCLKYGGWHREVSIRFCPMCGRRFEDDLISRQAILNVLRRECSTAVEMFLVDKVNSIPAAQPNVHDLPKDADCISRQAAIDAVEKHLKKTDVPDSYPGIVGAIREWLNDLPSAQPEIKPIEYHDCANAMLRMWMDNVVTDGEYNRIMDKLNAHWRRENG